MLQLSSSTHGMFPETGSMIAERIRGEFREMPGLILTAAQACRLWSLDVSTCHAALATLVDAGFLCRKADGTYGRASDLAVRPRMAKAGIQLVELDR
jgi:hypothetical protein